MFTERWARHNNVQQTIGPTSTWQTRKRSALGCCATDLISPTTTPENGGQPGRALRQTSHGEGISQLLRRKRRISQNSRSQDSGIAWLVPD